MLTQTKITQGNITAKIAQTILEEGNNRFAQNFKSQRNLKEQEIQTSEGQYPFAVILSCIDSRVPAELVFDQGIGDIFSVRVAGNIVNEDILGSMEYACKVAGSKLLVVLGHTKCGAVTAACKNVELGNITSLLKKIKPAVTLVKAEKGELNDEAIEKVSITNVKISMDRIREESPILAEMENNGEIDIIGAIYNVTTGLVNFL